MTRRYDVIRYGLALFLLAHGLVHAIGVLSAWQLAAIPQVSATPALVPGLRPGDPVLLALGALWLAAMAAFLVAAVGVALDGPWWRPLAAMAASLSLFVCILWWNDAVAGIVADVVVLIAVVAWPWVRSSPQSLAGSPG